MGKLAIYEKAEALRHEVAARGHHVVYRASETNRCPGCGRAQWYVGRVTAECVFCGTAIVLAEAQMSGNQTPYRDAKAMVNTPWDNNRRHKRESAKGRRLQLLLADSPQSFALENVSEGGAMGRGPVGLTPDTALQVRQEDGSIVSARVVWVEGDLVGLAFESAGH